MAVKYLAGERLIGTAAERAALTTVSTPTWTANFAIGSPMSNGWSVANSGTIFALDSSNNELDFNSTRGTNYSLSYDLQHADALNGSNASPTAWVCRFVIDIDDITESSTNGNTMAIILDSSSSGTGVSSASDKIGMFTLNSTETGAGSPWYLENDFRASWSNNASNTANQWEISETDASTTSGIGDLLTEETWYVEMKRLSASRSSVRVTTSSDFTGGYAHTFTDLSNVDNLRYFKIGNASGSATTENYIQGSITSLKFWNSVTTAIVYPNLSNGTIFEESDTGKHYMFDGTSVWNEVT